ncbi:MAG: alpha/beta hydrolase [Gammaproteobacteria bacterium]|nr:alpha/beta hydrolase [Gammaproteobacteria bacterium]
MAAALVGLLLPLLLGLLLVIGWMYLVQDRLLYFPVRELVADPGDAGLAYRETWLETADGVRLHAWYLPHPRPRGALLFLHGNAGNISHRLDSLAIFHRLGLATLILDYRGYGRSGGTPDEHGTYRDADAGWAHLVGTLGFARERIVIFGRSLGGTIAAHAAAEHAPAGLILESTPTSIADLGAELYPWLPVRRLARHVYPAAEAVSRYPGPVLVVHSPGDEIVPYRHAARLLDAVGPRARHLAISGGHNDGFLVTGPAYVSGLDAFLDEVLGDGG